MAEKRLQTRIINKNGLLTAWETSSLPLKEGEIALAKVMVKQPDGTAAPTYIAKVGLEGKTFSESPMLFAPASDVHAWAKDPNKPAYNATEITRGESTVAANLTTIEEQIRTINAALGDGGDVSKAIKAAIEALDVEDSVVAKQFVTAVAEADGKISVTRRELAAEDIPTLEIAKINGLQAALDLKAAKTYVDEQDNAIKEDIAEINTNITETITPAIQAAQKTIDDYKTANNAALAEVKATAEAATTVDEATQLANSAVSTFESSKFNPLAERVGAVEGKASANETAITNLTNGAVKSNTEAIAKLAQDIGNVANVMNFRGVSTGATVGADISDPKAGDVIIFGDAEYVYDESGKWVKFGDASDNATAISNLQERVGSIEGDLGAEGWVKADIKAAKDQADQGVADAKTANDAIAIINGAGEGSIAKALADAKKYAEDEADAAELAAKNAANAYTDAEIDKVEETIEGINETIESNATTAANATKKVADDLAAEILRATAAEEAAAAKGQQGIDDAAAALEYAQGLATGQIKTNKEDIAAIKEDVAAIEENYAKVKSTSDGKFELVVGESEDVIIFDCGGVQ